MLLYIIINVSKKLAIDCRINNFTALSVVGVLQYAFLPLALCQILKSDKERGRNNFPVPDSNNRYPRCCQASYLIQSSFLIKSHADHQADSNTKSYKN